MPKKPAAKPAKKPTSKSVKKPAAKTAPKRTKTSPRTKIDKSMAVVLQATGLGQLTPIKPVVQPKVRSTAKPKSTAKAR